MWRFDNTISEFWAYFHCACAETPTYELPVKNLTSPFASVTPISCDGNNSSVGKHCRYILTISLVRMRRNNVNSASGLKTAYTIVFSDHDFFMKGLQLWLFDNTVSEFWAYFHPTCAETAIKKLSVKNLTPPFAPATSMSYKTRCISTTE